MPSMARRGVGLQWDHGALAHAPRVEPRQVRVPSQKRVSGNRFRPRCQRESSELAIDPTPRGALKIDLRTSLSGGHLVILRRERSEGTSAPVDWPRSTPRGELRL